MVNTALARRMLAQEARVEARSLRSGRLQPGEQLGVERALPKLKGLPIWMTDEAVSLTEITDMVAGWSVSPKLDFLIVDYLQLVRAPMTIRERRLQVEAVSHGLKTLALQFKLAVLCLSSLARTRDERGKERRPTLGDLRESGELEHDADIVLLLHREPMKPETDCIVAKNRDGRVGVAHLTFRHEFVAFDEAAHPDREGA
jgi:replicative DNA helicase